MTARDLYDRDFLEWTRCNAALLRAGRFDQADIEHIAEEIEDMGKSQRRELFSRLRILLIHLLKWQAQPERRGASWTSTINNKRREIAALLEDMPSLQPLLVQKLGSVYQWAAEDATRELELVSNPFPDFCPFTVEQVLDPEFFPNG